MNFRRFFRMNRVENGESLRMNEKNAGLHQTTRRINKKVGCFEEGRHVDRWINARL